MDNLRMDILKEIAELKSISQFHKKRKSLVVDDKSLGSYSSQIYPGLVFSYGDSDTVKGGTAVYDNLYYVADVYGLPLDRVRVSIIPSYAAFQTWLHDETIVSKSKNGRPIYRYETIFNLSSIPFANFSITKRVAIQSQYGFYPEQTINDEY